MPFVSRAHHTNSHVLEDSKKLRGLRHLDAIGAAYTNSTESNSRAHPGCLPDSSSYHAAHSEFQIHALSFGAFDSQIEGTATTSVEHSKVLAYSTGNTGTDTTTKTPTEKGKNKKQTVRPWTRRPGTHSRRCRDLVSPRARSSPWSADVVLHDDGRARDSGRRLRPDKVQPGGASTCLSTRKGIPKRAAQWCRTVEHTSGAYVQARKCRNAPATLRCCRVASNCEVANCTCAELRGTHVFTSVENETFGGRSESVTQFFAFPLEQRFLHGNTISLSTHSTTLSLVGRPVCLTRGTGEEKRVKTRSE